MPRIKLAVPSNKLATVIIPVRINDINYGNHVGNDAFVSILHEARVQWLQQLGYTELNIEGCGLILAGLQVEFKQQGFYGDNIEATLHIGEISRVGFELYYTLSTKRNNNTIVLVFAKTEMVCYSYDAKKVESLPYRLKQKLLTEF